MSEKDYSVPERITFGTKVLQVSRVLSAFSHSGNMRTAPGPDYRWIRRGEPLGSFIIEVHKTEFPILKSMLGTEPKEVHIPSPINGLLIIHSTYEFGGAPAAVLVPNDEPAAEDGKYMFRNLCALLVDHKRYYLKPSRYWSSSAWSEKQFEERIEEQLEQQCSYVDALPRYTPYFDEIRKKYPEFRHHVEHLQG